LYNKALEYQKAGNLSEAENQYLQALQTKPEDPDINNNLGCLYLSQERYSAAERYLKKAVDLKSNNPDFHFNLGVLYQETDKKNEAIEEFKKCFNSNPKSFEAAYNLGNLYFDLDDFENAMLYLEKAASLKSDFADVFFNLGMVNTNLNDNDKAVRYYTKYLQLITDTDEKLAVNSIIENLRKPEVIAAETKSPDGKPAFPANILVTGKTFSDPSNNNRLDASETGTLTIELENKTQYPGKVSILLTPISTNEKISVNKNIKVGIIGGLEKKIIAVDFRADSLVPTQECEYRIEVLEEYYHLDPAPFAFSFNTLEYQKPEIVTLLVDALDNRDVLGPNSAPLNNNNGLVEKNEMVKIILSVQNKGLGLAKDVKLEINLEKAEEGNINFRTVDGGTDNVFSIGDLNSGEFKRIPFVIFTNSFYNYPSVEVKAHAYDSNKYTDHIETFKFDMGQTFAKSEELKIEAIEEELRGEIVLDRSNLVDVDDVPEYPDNNRPNTVAVILGIEKYKYNASATYKVRDATIFYKYMRNVFGLPEQNIFFKINDSATKAEIDYAFDELSGWLKKRITPGQSELIIYLAGHGYPDVRSQKGYFIPYDVRAEQATNGIDLNELYEKINRINPKSTMIFIESCFSGMSVENQPLAVNINPVKIKIKFPDIVGKDFIVFTASSEQQVSSNSDQLKHGVFSYYLFRAFKGYADANDDKKLTVIEIWDYLNKNVPNEALKLDREQNPGIFPDLDILRETKLIDKTIIEYVK
ncbi:tetratricopeptide repeat protein, partial [candidate division KSB1 bacterium]